MTEPWDRPMRPAAYDPDDPIDGEVYPEHIPAEADADWRLPTGFDAQYRFLHGDDKPPSSEDTYEGSVAGFIWTVFLIGFIAAVGIHHLITTYL